MIENMQSQGSCSQKRTVHVHWDQMCIWLECLALCRPSCIALPDCFPMHCIIALNQTGEWDYNKDHTPLWIQQGALCTFVLLTALSFSVGNKIASNEGKSQRRPDIPAFILDRHWRCLILLYALHFISSKPSKTNYNQCSETLHVRDKACLCQRTCLPSLEMKCIYIRIEQHPKITDLYVSRVPSW